MEQAPKLNILSSVVFLILGVWIIYTVQTFPPAREGMSPAFFPIIGATTLMLLALIQLAKELIPRTRSRDAYFRIPREAAITILTVTVSTTLYIALVRSLGFIVTTVIYLLVVIPVLGGKDKRTIVAFSILAAFIGYVLMSVVFRIPLPRGVVERVIF